MARTVQQLVNRVREVLQDDQGVRYLDAQILAHTVDALQVARSVRPDLYVGQYATPLPDTLAIADPLPLPDQLFAAAAYYVCGACEMRDDEFAVDNRAMTLQAAYTKKLVSGM